MSACTPGLSSSPSAASTHDPGNVECPNGKPTARVSSTSAPTSARWQTNRSHDGALSGDYAIGMVPGYVAVRCSNDGFVVQEEIHPRFQSPAERCASR